jgi:hypothetical protein
VFLRSVYGNAWKVTSSQVPENFPPSLGIHYIVMYTGVRRFDRIPSLKPLVLNLRSKFKIEDKNPFGISGTLCRTLDAANRACFGASECHYF